LVWFGVGLGVGCGDRDLVLEDEKMGRWNTELETFHGATYMLLNYADYMELSAGLPFPGKCKIDHIRRL
jgi:hypothetical protein